MSELVIVCGEAAGLFIPAGRLHHKTLLESPSILKSALPDGPGLGYGSLFIRTTNIQPVSGSSHHHKRLFVPHLSISLSHFFCLPEGGNGNCMPADFKKRDTARIHSVLHLDSI